MCRGSELQAAGCHGRDAPTRRGCVQAVRWGPQPRPPRCWCGSAAAASRRWEAPDEPDELDGLALGPGHSRSGRLVTLQAYRFALDPTPAQARELRSNCGAARVAFNWGLAHVKAVAGQRAAEATYGIAGQDLTPSVSWSFYSLRKEWNAAKGEYAPWWSECSKEAFSTGVARLAQALENWDKSRTGRRGGAPDRKSTRLNSSYANISYG